MPPLGNTLKAGKLGDPSTVGKPSAFAGSMAEAMEDEFNNLLPADKKFTTNDNSPDSRDRRLLFVAIARGVVTYLSKNAEAFAHSSGNDLNAKHSISVSDP